MAVLTLLSLAVLIVGLNQNHYLRAYRASRLPQLRGLLFLLVIPLVLLDHRHPSLGLRIVWLLLLVVGMLASFIDWEHHLLPDRIIWPTMAISTIALLPSGHFPMALIGSLAWFSAFALLALVNPAGLGWGDVKFGALLGLDLGAFDLKLVPVAIFVGLVVGGSYAVALITKGHRQSQIPFGPFMFIGALTALIVG